MRPAQSVCHGKMTPSAAAPPLSFKKTRLYGIGIYRATAVRRYIRSRGCIDLTVTTKQPSFQ